MSYDTGVGVLNDLIAQQITKFYNPIKTDGHKNLFEALPDFFKLFILFYFNRVD